MFITRFRNELIDLISQLCSSLFCFWSLLVLEIPEVLAVTLSRGSLYVKWRKVKDATEYKLVIEEEQREEQREEQERRPPRLRTVEGDFYMETGLKPWTTYCVTLAAKNAIDQSSYSWPICRNTGASQ